MREYVCKKCKSVFSREWNAVFCSRNCANKYNSVSNSISKMGSKNPMYGKIPHNFNNGISYSKSGSRNVKYVTIKIGSDRFLEHRLVMESYLGRKLEDHEVVHHIDGNGMNNKIENLQLMTRSEHSRHHADVSFLKGGGVQCHANTGNR